MFTRGQLKSMANDALRVASESCEKGDTSDEGVHNEFVANPDILRCRRIVRRVVDKPDKSDKSDKSDNDDWFDRPCPKCRQPFGETMCVSEYCDECPECWCLICGDRKNYPGEIHCFI